MPKQQIPSSTSDVRRSGRRRFPGQRVIVIGFVIVSVLALAVFIMRTNSWSTIANINRVDVTNTEAVAYGKQLYASRCASCHGSDLEGEQGWPQRRENGVMPASPLNADGPLPQRDDA